MEGCVFLEPAEIRCKSLLCRHSETVTVLHWYVWFILCFQFVFHFIALMLCFCPCDFSLFFRLLFIFVLSPVPFIFYRLRCAHLAHMLGFEHKEMSRRFYKSLLLLDSSGGGGDVGDFGFYFTCGKREKQTEL